MTAASHVTTKNLFDVVFDTIPEDAFIDFGPENIVEARALASLHEEDGNHHHPAEGTDGGRNGAGKGGIRRLQLASLGVRPATTRAAPSDRQSVLGTVKAVVVKLDSETEAVQRAAAYAATHVGRSSAPPPSSRSEDTKMIHRGSGAIEMDRSDGTAAATVSSSAALMGDILDAETVPSTSAALPGLQQGQERTSSGLSGLPPNRQLTAEEQTQRMPPGLPILYEGTCATMQPAKGFGFITPDLGGPDVYFTRESVLPTFTQLVMVCYCVQKGETVPGRLLRDLPPLENSTGSNRWHATLGAVAAPPQATAPIVAASAPPTAAQQEEHNDKRDEAGERGKEGEAERETAAPHPAEDTDSEGHHQQHHQDTEKNEEVAREKAAPAPPDDSPIGRVLAAVPQWGEGTPAAVPGSSAVLSSPSSALPLPPTSRKALEAAWRVAARLGEPQVALLRWQLEVGTPCVYHQHRLSFSVHRNRAAQRAMRLLRAEQVRGMRSRHYATPEEQAWFCEAFPQAIGHKHYAPSADSLAPASTAAAAGEEGEQAAPTRMLERYEGYIRTYSDDGRRGYIACDAKESALLQTGGGGDPNAAGPPDVMFFWGSVLFHPSTTRRVVGERLRVRYCVSDIGRHSKYLATLITGVDDEPLSERNYLLVETVERWGAHRQHPAHDGAGARGGGRGGAELEESTGGARRGGRRGAGAKDSAPSGVDGTGKSTTAALLEQYVGSDEDADEDASGRKRLRGAIDHVGEGEEEAGRLHHTGGSVVPVNASGAAPNTMENAMGGAGNSSGAPEEAADNEEDLLLFMDDYDYGGAM
eukprot:gene12296-8437_t